jgi:hypothetical protein
VLRIFAGDVTPGEIEGQKATQAMWMTAAVIMLIPIGMIVLSLTVPYPTIRWVNVVAAAFLVVFNLVGLPYKSVFDNFLIAVGFVFTGLIAWYAWTWQVLA